jgi:hypothetical protein
MKNIMIFTATVCLALFFWVTTSQAQGWIDRIEEGKQVVAGGNLMLAYGNKLAAKTDPDRAWLADKGHILMKRGFSYMDNGQMDFSQEASDFMQQIGNQLLESGGVLLKIGRKQGPLTQQEKDSIAKQAKLLKDIGTLMLKNGQLMTD